MPLASDATPLPSHTGADALAATLRGLRLPPFSSVNPQQLEWMYSLPGVEDLLDSIATTLSPGAASCILPATTPTHDTSPDLPPDSAAYVLSALPPVASNPVASDPLPDDPAADRLRVLRVQKELLLEMDQAPSEPDDEPDEPDSALEPWLTSTDFRSALYALDGAATAVCEISSALRKVTAARARAVGEAHAAYAAAEADLLALCGGAAAAAWKSGGGGGKGGVADGGGEAERLVEMCATTAAQAVEAAVERARLTGVSQALGGACAAGGGGSAVELERAVQSAIEAVEARSVDVCRVAYEREEEYVRARFQGVAEGRRAAVEERRVGEGKFWLAVLAPAVARCAVSATALARSEDESVQMLDTLKFNSEKLGLGNTAWCRDRTEEELGASKARGDELTGVEASGIEILERAVDSKIDLRRGLDESAKWFSRVRRDVWDASRLVSDKLSDRVWSPNGSVARTARTTSALNDARLGVGQGGNMLRDLLTRRKEKDAKRGGAEDVSRSVWIAFF